MAYWVPDHAAQVCVSCQKGFNLFVRKHHCRSCGMIFCDDCSSKQMAIPQTQVIQEPNLFNMVNQLDTMRMGMLNPMGVPNTMVLVRVCNSCYNTRHQAQAYSQVPQAIPTRVLPPPPAPHPAVELCQGPSLSIDPGPLPIFPAAVSLFDRSEMLKVLYTLQSRHIPPGIAGGFVITDAAFTGGLGQQYGLQAYDFMYGVENTFFTQDTEQAKLSLELFTAFNTKGFGTLHVYNFQYQSYRKIHIQKPPGLVSAPATGILAVSCAQLPVSNKPAGLVAESPDVYTKAWTKSGMMYVSIGQAVPVYAPLTVENADVYVKVFRNVNGMWISHGNYHPLYNYPQLMEPLYVEAWNYNNGILSRFGSKYAKLPMNRLVSSPPTPQPASQPAPQSDYPQQPQQYSAQQLNPQGH